MPTDFRCIGVASTSLLLSLVTTPVAFLGNWLSGEGSPNAGIDVVLLLLVGWAFYAALLAIAQAVQKRVAASDVYLPLQERRSPRVGREFAASLLVGVSTYLLLARLYLTGDLDFSRGMVALGAGALFVAVAVLGVRLHWRTTASGGGHDGDDRHGQPRARRADRG